MRAREERGRGEGGERREGGVIERTMRIASCCSCCKSATCTAKIFKILGCAKNYFLLALSFFLVPALGGVPPPPPPPPAPPPNHHSVNHLSLSLSLSNAVTYASSYDSLYTLTDRKLILACTCCYVSCLYMLA
jgi:hypothetical protein